jgi:chromodomain-helicase-DNA-binding protein 1
MKFGNLNQIDLIVEEVGGTVAAAPPEEQIELFDALVEGCREAVEVGNLDPKVGFLTMHTVCWGCILSVCG